MELRWDNGFYTDEQAYFDRRLELQGEIEKLTPVANDDQEQATATLRNLLPHLMRCGSDVEAQNELVRVTAECVCVEEEDVIGITPKPTCHRALGHNVNGPTEFTVDPFQSAGPTAKSRYTSGDDGI